MTVAVYDREAIEEAPNPLGMDGIEYVEYSTNQPQALGHVLETMGFRAVARHRSREVLLYRQGEMNVVVNAHAGVLRATSATDDGTPRISALALRVHDARAAYERAIALGAWEMATHAHVMELNIPGIHGPGGAHIYFIDRYRDFSIYSVDFVPIPGADQWPQGTARLNWFGIVQYIGSDRTDDWVEFYHQLLGFVRLPQDVSFGILPRGTLLQSPQGGAIGFYLQLIEPDRATVVYDEQELFHRIGFCTPDVPAAVAVLRGAGVDFVDSSQVHVTERGAITRNMLGSVSFEFVHDPRVPPQP